MLLFVTRGDENRFVRNSRAHSNDRSTGSSSLFTSFWQETTFAGDPAHSATEKRNPYFPCTRCQVRSLRMNRKTEKIMSDWIDVGRKAPDFTLPADDGGKVKLSQLRGQVVVLYFYPRDNTPGCTKEACAFRDSSAELKRLGVTVLGVSPDGVESHQKFRDKFELSFPLLADVQHKVAEKYGAWREKTRFGKTSMGIQRSTYLIDAEGIVRKLWKSVKVDGHNEQVIKVVEELG